MSFISRLFNSSSENSSEINDFSGLVNDIHSHFLPGIDDGASTINDSLNLGKAFLEMGYKKVITTPHVMADGFPNKTDTILEKLNEVRSAFKSADIPLEIEASAEYYLDEGFESQLNKKDVLPFFIDGSPYLLFEANYVSRPMNLEGIIFRMNSLGYKPVLAHPERYNWLWGKKLTDLEELKNTGVLFQVNISSFGDIYSERAGNIARMLAKAEMIEFLGSDCHHLRHIGNMKMALDRSPELRKLILSGKILNARL